MSECFLAAEGQCKKAPALLAPCEHSFSTEHWWVLERVLPSSSGRKSSEQLIVLNLHCKSLPKGCRAAQAVGCSVLCTASLQWKGLFSGEREAAKRPQNQGEHQGVAIRVNCFDVQ